MCCGFKLIWWRSTKYVRGRRATSARYPAAPDANPPGRIAVSPSCTESVKSIWWPPTLKPLTVGRKVSINCWPSSDPSTTRINIKCKWLQCKKFAREHSEQLAIDFTHWISDGWLISSLKLTRMNRANWIFTKCCVCLTRWTSSWVAATRTKSSSRLMWIRRSAETALRCWTAKNSSGSSRCWPRDPIWRTYSSSKMSKVNVIWFLLEFLVFFRYAESNCSVMTADELVLLLAKEQHMKVDAARGRQLIDKYEPTTSTNRSQLSRAGFTNMMGCPQLFNIRLEEHAVVNQDMTRPLNQYYIASSHNTYWRY